MRLNSSQTWAIVGVATLLWFALGLLGVTSGDGLQGFLSARDIVPLLLLAGSIFERWLWRGRWFHLSRIAPPPVVLGTWRGELASSYVSPNGDPTPVKTAYLAVRQTATTIAVRLLTDESASEPIGGAITTGESGYPAIAYNYRNRPDITLRHGVSEIHYGGAIIDIVNDPATRLEGDYWTDRKTKGRLRFAEHSPEIAQTFEDAVSLTFGPPRPVGIFGSLGRH